MARICYVPKTFRPAALETIRLVNEICRTYQGQGYDLTLRQLYYQFVARDLIPNRQSEYKRLGDIVNDGRLAGLIDWNYIVDRTRNLRGIPHLDSPKAALTDAAARYHIDMWARQPRRVEVWVEKDALVGVVQRAANQHDCSFFSCRGYTSQSELWGAAQRLGNYARAGQDVVVLHLGDHDPSGIDMTRDIEDRLSMFISEDNKEVTGGAVLKFMKSKGFSRFDDMPESEQEMARRVGRMARSRVGQVQVRRIALNMSQVEIYNPPPNPAKITDSRYEGYVAIHGSSSWELDALDPRTLDDLIQNEIMRLRDDTIWREDHERMERERLLIQGAGVRWTEVADWLQETG